MNIRKPTISSKGNQQNDFRETRKEYPLKLKRKDKGYKKTKT